jgi:hypothetical protein
MPKTGNVGADVRRNAALERWRSATVCGAWGCTVVLAESMWNGDGLDVLRNLGEVVAKEV